MLQNEYLVAKIGFDTAENEPPKVSGGSEFHPTVSHTGPTAHLMNARVRTKYAIKDDATIQKRSATGDV